MKKKTKLLGYDIGEKDYSVFIYGYKDKKNIVHITKQEIIKL